MIRHIVFFSAKYQSDLETIEKGLSLLKNIPHADKLEVTRNSKRDMISPDTVDVVVYGEFKDFAALDAYKAHPLYQESINIVRPLRELRLAADYETA